MGLCSKNDKTGNSTYKELITYYEGEKIFFRDKDNNSIEFKSLEDCIKQLKDCKQFKKLLLDIINETCKDIGDFLKNSIDACVNDVDKIEQAFVDLITKVKGNETLNLKMFLMSLLERVVCNSMAAYQIFMMVYNDKGKELLESYIPKDKERGTYNKIDLSNSIIIKELLNGRIEPSEIAKIQMDNIKSNARRLAVCLGILDKLRDEMVELA